MQLGRRGAEDKSESLLAQLVRGYQGCWHRDGCSRNAQGSSAGSRSSIFIFQSSGGVDVLPVSSQLEGGMWCFHTHTSLCRASLRWSLILPFRQQSEPFVQEMGLCRYGKDKAGRDLDVEEWLERWVLPPASAAPSHQAWDPQGLWVHLHPQNTPENPAPRSCEGCRDTAVSRSKVALISGSRLPAPFPFWLNEALGL